MYSGCDYVIPTNLVCVLVGIAIPTSSFNLFHLYLCKSPILVCCAWVLLQFIHVGFPN